MVKRVINNKSPGNKRFYSTKQSEEDKDFWRKVNSSNETDKSNPFILVNSFLKENYSKELVKKNLDFKVVCSILSCHRVNYDLTLDEFNILMNIKPVRFELPVSDSSLKELVGKNVHKTPGKPGAYMLINQDNGFKYVGSSISLANRLSVGYLGPTLGKRVIDLAIKDVGLERFYLEIYLIPEKLINLTLAKEESQVDSDRVASELGFVGQKKITDLTLTLEQILILIHNPEYNVLKVAGSPAGNKRSLDTILPSILKNSKFTYLINNETNEVIYIAKSRTELAKILKTGVSNISAYIRQKYLYLGRLTITNGPIDESVFTTNFMSLEELLDFVDEKRTIRRKEVMSNVDSKRSATVLKVSNPVELTNVKTNEVFTFKSLVATVEYVKKIYPKASCGSFSVHARKGTLYKNTFKFKYISKESHG